MPNVRPPSEASGHPLPRGSRSQCHQVGVSLLRDPGRAWALQELLAGCSAGTGEPWKIHEDDELPLMDSKMS